jgi:hypothetical protein
MEKLLETQTEAVWPGEEKQFLFPEEIKDLLDYAFDYIGTSTRDWFLIKKQLVNLFPPKHRSLFSRRHFSTKKHILNLFDKAVINYWEEKTGQKLEINPDKLHQENRKNPRQNRKQKDIELENDRKLKKQKLEEGFFQQQSCVKRNNSNDC